jgi:hypothetical protein
MIINDGREKEYNELQETIKRRINTVHIEKDHVRNNYNLYQSFMMGYKCNNDLIHAFGLQGVSTEYPTANSNPLYCASNTYTCCNNHQVDSAKATFGRGLVNLKKNLEPLIELVSALKTEKFIQFMGANSQNQVCKNIIFQAFGKNITDKNFKMKKFITKIYK